MGRLCFAAVGTAVVLASAADAALASRPATYLERVTIMEAFNKPGRSFASRCVRVVVSTADARYALLTSPFHIPKACMRAGEVGDGYVLFRRRSRTSLSWRDIQEGSDVPCGRLPIAVLRDLFPKASC